MSRFIKEGTESIFAKNRRLKTKKPKLGVFEKYQKNTVLKSKISDRIKLKTT